MTMKKKTIDSQQNNKGGGKNRTRRKLNFILFIGAILFSVCIQTGHFTKNHSFLILHSEQNITCNSWITSHPYSHHNFYHTLLLMLFVMLVISRSAVASFSMYVFWRHLKLKVGKMMNVPECI